MEKWSWRGARGNLYPFDVRQPFDAFPRGGGVYVFAVRPRGADLDHMVRAALYVGSTPALAEALEGHPQWREALVLGASEVHVLAIRNPTIRAYVAGDLEAGLEPTLNEIMLPYGVSG